MSLIYDPDTAQPRRDLTYYDQIETENLNQSNVVGRTQDMQTDRFFYFFGATGTYTLTTDVILTCIGLYLSSDAGLSKSRAYIDAVQVAEAGADNGNAVSKILPIPNWLLKAGTILSSNISAAPNDGSVEFIGYIA